MTSTSLPSGTTIRIGRYSVSKRMSPPRWLRRDDTASDDLSRGLDMGRSVTADPPGGTTSGPYAAAMS